jgi:hypothetical protein
MHRYFIGTLAALGLLLVACGDDGDAASAATGNTASSSGASSSESAAGGSGGAPGAGGSGTMGGAGGCSGTGELSYGDGCECDAQCAAVGEAQGVCFTFGMGPQCTIGCPADPMDCPNAGKGCNNKQPAVCKI